MSTVKTKDGSRTLLHIVGEMVIQKDSTLVDFLDRVEHLEDAAKGWQ